ncbi:MAG TPA: hypothetical protein VK483_06215, partial [Chitinophagaceae bacterium]|nr:hypothetical protein [Chitinophagaceae bacterium]
HNNSFLCAGTVLGQSNMAAGATIGSNHNSRSADGELVAGRGFWPGLCVSLKYNSKFASFTLIAKGDFPAELNIPVPFSLVSNDVSSDKLVVMPGYWFMHNMYALARNADKYEGRDKRTDKTQVIEYDFLAPDSVNELFNGLQLMKQFTAKAYAAKNKKTITDKGLLKTVETLLETDPAEIAKLEILAEGFECSNRKTELVKVSEAYRLFKEMIIYYGVTELIRFIEQKNISSWQKLLQALPGKPVRNTWKNIGGQLMPEADLLTLTRNIRSGKINSWDEVHSFYNKKSAAYHHEKFRHAFASLLEILKLSPSRFTKKLFLDILQQAVITKEWMVKGIYDSRAKDYNNPFRKMLYETEKEMEKVIGKLGENSFIRQQQTAYASFKEKVDQLSARFK